MNKTLLLLKKNFKKKYERKKNRELNFGNALLHSRLQRIRFFAALTQMPELWFGRMLNNFGYEVRGRSWIIKNIIKILRHCENAFSAFLFSFASHLSFFFHKHFSSKS